MRIEQKVGPQTPGALQDLRALGDGTTAVSDAHARFMEAVYRGKVFYGSTTTAGAAPGTAIGTTAPFALYNPPNSNVQVVIWKAYLWAGSTLGTIGAGVIFAVPHVQGTAAPTFGTAIAAQNALIGSRIQSAVLLGMTVSTLATPLGTTNAAFVRPLWNIGALALSASGDWVGAEKILDGDMIVAQGGALSIQEVGAAGTTPLLGFTFVWEEVPANLG